jgi:hypothetical protein
VTLRAITDQVRRDKNAYSITSSARPSKGSGIAIPSSVGRLEIDDHLNFRWLLDWEVRRLFTFEDAAQANNLSVPTKHR